MSFRLFQSLLFRASKIQQRIDDEQSRTMPNKWRLLKLKKIRLLIASRLQGLLDPGVDLQLRPVPVRTSKRYYR